MRDWEKRLGKEIWQIEIMKLCLILGNCQGNNRRESFWLEMLLFAFNGDNIPVYG